MADAITEKQRSKVMAAIRSSGNRNTELRMVTIMRQHGITGWRRNSRLPGKPDFVFPRDRVAVFVDGCFWHGCRWHCRMPKSRQDYWEPKIFRNKTRDKKVRQLLESQGWKVKRIWEHALDNASEVALTLIETLAQKRIEDRCAA